LLAGKGGTAASRHCGRLAGQAREFEGAKQGRGRCGFGGCVGRNGWGGLLGGSGVVGLGCRSVALVVGSDVAVGVDTEGVVVAGICWVVSVRVVEVGAACVDGRAVEGWADAEGGGLVDGRRGEGGLVLVDDPDKARLTTWVSSLVAGAGGDENDDGDCGGECAGEGESDDGDGGGERVCGGTWLVRRRREETFT